MTVAFPGYLYLYFVYCIENTQKRCTNRKKVNTHKIEIEEYFLCVNNIFMNNKVISRLQVKSLLSK